MSTTLAFSPDGKRYGPGAMTAPSSAFDRQRADTLVHRASQAVTDGPPLPGNSVDMIIGPGSRYMAYPTANIVPFRIRDIATGALGAPSAEDDGDFKTFSADGERYVTVDDTGVLRVWDTATGAALADSEGGERLFSFFPAGAKAVFTPDGRNVVALETSATDPDDFGLVPETLVVLDATTLAPVGGEPVPLGYVGRTISVAPDGRQAVVVGNTPGEGVTNVLLVDLETRRIIRSTPVAEFDQRLSGASEQHGRPGRSDGRHQRDARRCRGRRRGDGRGEPGPARS